MNRLFSSVLIFFISAGVGLAAEKPDQKTLQHHLEEVRVEYKMPAISAAVVQGNDIVGAVSGVKIAGKEDPVHLDSRFHIGSVTKPMTATIIAMLVEEGKIQWESRVFDVFPEWEKKSNPQFQKITLSQLLSHEAGIQAFEDDPEFSKLPVFQGDPASQRRHFAEYVLRQEPIGKPGQEFHYSNAGFSIAAAMAEKVSGESWESMMRRRLFEPLGMKTGGFGWPAKEHPDEPWGHQQEGDQLKPHDPQGAYQLPAIIAPAGNVHTSMIDLAKFAQFHLLALQGKSSLLKATTVQHMHTPRIKGGLGWGVQKLLDFYPVSVFAGSAETFNTLIAVLPKQNVAVVVSTNAYNENAEAACKKILKQWILQYAST